MRFTYPKSTKETLGDLLVQSLTEVRDGVRGRLGKLTMKTVEIPDPPRFGAASFHRLHNQLGLSQGLFAKLLSISRKANRGVVGRNTHFFADGVPVTRCYCEEAEFLCEAAACGVMN